MKNVTQSDSIDSSIVTQKYLLPMLVPDVNETSDQFRVRWERFRLLSENIRDILADEHVMRIIQKLGERAGLDLESSAFLARAVRLYYFGELPLEKFVDYFVKNIGVSSSVAESLMRTIAAQIIKKPIKETRERMTIRVALDRFKKIAHQVITDAQLIVAGTQKQSPGTVENWITDYHLAIGQGKHSAIERGNYLFHNRNTKGLSAADRQHVAMVLKSFDEDMAMIVDTDREEIVFPPAQKIPRRTGVETPSTGGLRPNDAQHAISKGNVRSTQNNGIMNVGTQSSRAQTEAGVRKQPAGYVNFSSGQRIAREKEMKKSL